MSYTKQLEELNRTEASLKNLTAFVSEQKTKLKESETVLSSLQEEQQKLAPLVAADRKAVSAIFDLQETRNNSNIAHERWISFWLGRIAYIIATILCSIAVYISRRVDLIRTSSKDLKEMSKQDDQSTSNNDNS